MIEINQEFTEFFNDPKRERLTGWQIFYFFRDRHRGLFTRRGPGRRRLRPDPKLLTRALGRAVGRFECDPRRAKYQHQHASLFERPDIGDNVGDLAARQIYVRHYGMRIHEEGRERFRGRYFVRDRGKTRRVRIGSRLIGRDQMAGGAPALGDDLALCRIGGKSAER